MPQLIDLTRPLEPVEKSKFPAVLQPLLRIIAPDVEYVDHSKGAQIMAQLFNCPVEDLPAGEGWAEEEITLCSHLGTHVDAPWHYGSTCGGKKAKTVDEIPLDELYLDGVVIDVTHKKGTGAAITVEDLQSGLEKIGYRIKQGDAVLIRTDHDKFALTDPMRYLYPGMTRESALWLADQGAKIGGTDALGWDRPFPVMVMDYQKTRDKKYIWDAHFAYRDAEVYVIQQLINLDLLPPHSFKVCFFPIKLVGASAAPCRAVAFVD